MSDWDPLAAVDAVEQRLWVQSVEELHARAQDLIDSRPEGEYPVDWCFEAKHIGDLTALGMLAALAAGVPRRRS